MGKIAISKTKNQARLDRSARLVICFADWLFFQLYQPYNVVKKKKTCKKTSAYNRTWKNNIKRNNSFKMPVGQVAMLAREAR